LSHPGRAPRRPTECRIEAGTPKAFVDCRTSRGPCRGALRRHDCAHRPALDLVGRIAGTATSRWLCAVPIRPPSQATDYPIGTAIKPRYRLLTVVSNIIAAKFGRFALT